MSDEPIPLYDGVMSGHVILPESGSAGAKTQTLRSRRTTPRKNCENVHVCFSPESASGSPDNAECPIVNISANGMAIEYDRRLTNGVSGHVSYYTISRIPVRISCTVQHCAPMENGYFQIGLRLNRPLKYEERKPMRVGVGRVIAPHVRARKLRPPQTDSSTRTTSPSQTPTQSGDAPPG